MKRNIIKSFLFSLIVMAAFSGCRKDDFVDDDTLLGDQGKTISIFQETSATTVLPAASTLYAPWTNLKAVTAFNVRRNSKDNADLNTTTTVTITPLATLPANTANITYVQMPLNAITLQANSKVVKSGNNFVVTFSPGDSHVDVVVLVDGTQLDPTVRGHFIPQTTTFVGKRYSLAYTLSSMTGTGIITAGTGATLSGKNRTVAFQIQE